MRQLHLDVFFVAQNRRFEWLQETWTSRIFRFNSIYFPESTKLKSLFFPNFIQFRSHVRLSQLFTFSWKRFCYIIFQFIYLSLRSASPVVAHVVHFNVFLICIQLFSIDSIASKSKCGLSIGSHCISLLIPWDFKTLEKCCGKKIVVTNI